MKFTILLTLLGLAFASLHQRHQHQRQQQNQQKYDLNNKMIEESAFRQGGEYQFVFNGQLSTGLSTPSKPQGITRLQTLVTIQMHNEHTARMQLNNFKFAASQEEKNLRTLQPFEQFEMINLEKEHQQLLELPVEFTYTNGMISNIRFEHDDQSWSENIKRAVMNMLQVNIQKSGRVEKSKNTENMDKAESSDNAFIAFEKTLEGECEMFYTIEDNINREEDQQRWTKSINFEKCAQRPVFHQAQSQVCKDCQSTLEPQQMSSTVFSFNVTRNQNEEQFLINFVELKSQHLFTSLNEKHQLLSAFTFNTLELVYAGEPQTPTIGSVQNSNTATLVYNPQWELAEQQWARTGDEKYLRQIPHLSRNNVEIVEGLFSLMAKQIEQGEIELETSHNVARIVKMMRLCNEEELKRIFRHVVSLNDETIGDQIRSIYFNILTLAATRATIQQFVENAQQLKYMTPIKASFALKSLVDMQYPSTQIAQDLETLCTSVSHQMLRQSCWLTYGSIVNGACSSNNQKWVENDLKTTCPRDVKQRIVDRLFAQFEASQTRNDQILVLKTIANAGIDMSIYQLEQIMNDKKYEITIRVQAVESLRRLRQSMPIKIQQILLPIYKNRQQPQHLRMSALYQIVLTQPQWPVLSQIGQQLRQERNQQVRSFTLSLLQSFANSESVCEKTFSSRLQSLLQTIPFNAQNIQEYESRYGKWSNYWQKYQGGFDADFANLFTNESILPTEMMTSLNGVFSGEWNQFIGQIGFTQKNVEKFLKQFLSKIQEKGFEQIIVRGKRSTQMESFQPTQFLNNLLEKIGFARRQSNSQEPHALFYIRHRDMDYAFLPIDAQSIPDIVKSMMNGGRIEIGDIERVLAQGIQFAQTSASFVYETVQRVPTPLGITVQLTSKMPTVASINGQFKFELEPKKSQHFNGVLAHLTAQPRIASTHILSLTTLSPIAQTGAKFLHQIVYNTPIDMKINMNWANKLVFESWFMTPTDEVRMLMLQSRPVTFVRSINTNARQYPEPVEMTWIQPSYELISQPINRQYGCVKVQGTWNQPLSRRVPLWIIDNTIEMFYIPNDQTPNQYKTRIELDLFKSMKMDKSMKQHFKKSPSKAQRFMMQIDEEYDEMEQNNEIEKNFEWLENEQVFQHLINVEVEPEILNFNVDSVCNSNFHFCKTNFKSEILNGNIQYVYPMIPKTLDQIKQQKYRNVLIIGETTWNNNNVEFKIEGQQSAEQQSWINTIQNDDNELIAEASRLDQYQFVMEYDWQTSTTNTFERLWNLLQAYARTQYPFSSVIQSNQGKTNMIRAKLNIEPRQRQTLNLTIETPEERLNVERVEIPFTLPTAQIHYQPTSQRWQQKSTAEKLIHGSTKKAECVVKSSKIQTFDRVFFSNQFTSCFSVLASDCSQQSKTPRFVVLMKKIENGNQLMIVYKGNEMEIEKINNRLRLSINNEEQTEQNEVSMKNFNIIWMNKNTIKFESDEINVQFDGVNARIQLSAFYQQQQCGLCGHYDNENENDFYAADNQQKSIPEFVKSYIFDDENCNVDEKMFDNQQLFKQIDEDDNDEDLMEWEENVKNVPRPQQQIVVIEKQRETCFTLESVRRCSEAQNVAKSFNKKTNVLCLPSSSSWARRMMRDIRREPFAEWPEHKLRQLRENKKMVERQMNVKRDEKCF